MFCKQIIFSYDNKMINKNNYDLSITKGKNRLSFVYISSRNIILVKNDFIIQDD